MMIFLLNWRFEIWFVKMDSTGMFDDNLRPKTQSFYGRNFATGISTKALLTKSLLTLSQRVNKTESYQKYKLKFV
jgi:hypothetical protein